MIIRDKSAHARRRPPLANLCYAQVRYLETLRGAHQDRPVHCTPQQWAHWEAVTADRAARLESAVLVARGVAIIALAVVGLAVAVAAIGGVL